MRESDSARRFTVRVDDEEWTETRSLSEAAPDDNVFIVDRLAGRVVFGDGAHGRRPSRGAVVTVSYREGSGAAGNACVSITTQWPSPDSRYLVTLSSAGVRISGGVSVERFGGVKRPSFFDGQLLSAADFRAEQEYLLRQRYLHNQALHGWGVASGLSVTVSGDGSSPSVRVAPGLALDRRGREIELAAPVVLPIGNPGCSPYVIVEFTERETDPVPSPTNGDGTVASRIEEGASIRLSPEALADEGVVLARLVSDSTGWKVDSGFEPTRCR